MQNRFYFNRSLVNTVVAIFGISLLVMVGSSLLVNQSLRQVLFLAISSTLLALFWVSFSRGSYITIDEKNLYGTVFFIQGKVTTVADIVSIHKRATFGGLIAEAYMNVRKRDGKIVERGLIGIPGLKESDMRKLLDMIRSINPNVEVDQDLMRK